MAEGNSFTNLLKLMSEQGYNKDVSVTIGSVKSPNPLSIIIDTITLEEGDFTKSQVIQYLIENKLGPTPLKAGDKVLILIDGNNFYVIDRVVS